MTANRRITILGDSIARGSIDPFVGPFAVGSFHAHLVDRYGPGGVASPEVSIHNVAVGGTTSRDWRPDRPLFDLVAASNVVIALVGANDCRGVGASGIPTTPDDFEQNLEDVADALLCRGVHNMILVTQPELDLAKVPSPAPHLVELAEYAVRLRAMAGVAVSIADWAEAVESAGLAPIPIHPNETQSFYLFSVLKALLDPILL